MPVDYHVTIHLSDASGADTTNRVYVTLVGEKGKSESQYINGGISLLGKNEYSGAISCPEDLGKILLIKLDKWSIGFEDPWCPTIAEVESPIGKKFCFPIYRWITDDEGHCFREGTAALWSQDGEELRRIREQEIEKRRTIYCWGQDEEGIPYGMKADGPSSLPYDDQYSRSRKIETGYTYFSYYIHNFTASLWRRLKQWYWGKDEWTSISDIESKYHEKPGTRVSDYVRDHWKDDDFFGYQFLNGINPRLIQRCKALPENFPVCSNVELQEEIKNGNIFLCDYKILDGVETNTINEKKQYLAAPLVLLRLDGGKMKPIAIQLKQTPGQDNPVFRPTDRSDWLLAKIFVRSADFNLHELNSHLLSTHLLADVFAVSLKRNLPMVHPLYKLLIPHFRYTLFINSEARKSLISKDGTFTKFAASGGEGMLTILRRSLETLTYRSLCIKDDIKDRGLEDVPNFYYKEDGEKLWDIIHRFVEEMLGLYYKDDNQVKQDCEVQNWILDIFKHGFLSCKEHGIPDKFESLPDLVKFVTMVMYTCSAQHSAVNTGQYDFYGWMPNGPSSLQLPPPTTKGEVTQKRILATFPNMETTVNAMSTVWLLSNTFGDAVHLGDYPQKQFTEECSRLKIRPFQRELKKLSTEINDRNKNMEIKYNYLDPLVMENSVSI